MDCPRCHLSLSDAEYEAEQIHFCGTCWGYWLTREQLDRIVGAAEYKFGKRESKAVEKSLRMEGDADRQGSESKSVECPECGNGMARKRYADSCPVQIDECREHGIWLDTGEIKDLQVFIERSLD